MSKSKYDIRRIRPYRSYEVLAIRDSLGRRTQTRLKLTCPFCYEGVVAFRWSLCGSGKKCPRCSALHTGSGTMPLRQAAEAKGRE